MADGVNPPSGTVTFLFTDVVGSTATWERQSEAMAAAMARHDELIAGFVRSRQGMVVKSTGDGVMAVFESAEEAVRTAIDIQAAVASGDWGIDGGFRLRAGLHTGVADERDGDYFGPTVNRAARLMSAGHGGQVLVSAATAELVGSAVGALVDLGMHRLKDLSRSEHVFQVPVPGTEETFARLTTVDSVRGNLPRPPTSFVGRTNELAEVLALVEESRLTTLVGVGGAGKTRLALEAAAQLSDRFTSGVWLIELWQIDDPDLLADTVIATLGLQYGQGRDAREVIVDALGFAPELLVLDTCEHLVEPVAELVEELLSRCPELHVLATSREALASQYESVRRVESLGADAVDLFCERAATTRGGAPPGDDDMEAVAAICGQLDGIPLAIEIVAARSATLEPSELLRRLSDVFRVVRDRRGTRADRHRTLEATIEWSYRLLEPDEAELFERVSVFRGGFTLAAAEAVCSDDEVIDALDVVDHIERLVDKSLVSPADGASGRRFRLLDTTRAYAAARLAERDDPDQLNERHARFFADWAADCEQRRYEPGVAMRIRQITAEVPNLQQAADWSVAHADLDAALGVAVAARLLGLAARYDAAEWLAAIFELPGVDDHPSAVPAMTAYVGQLFGSGDLAGAEAIAQRALAIRDDAVMRSVYGPMLRARATRTVPPDQELLDEAFTHTRAAVSLAADDATLLGVYGPLLFFLSGREDLTEFYEHWERVERLLEEQGSELARVVGANSAGALVAVDPERARPIVQRALEESTELGVTFITTRMRSYLADIEKRSGDPHTAARLLLDTIVEDAAIGSLFTVHGWMHRLVAVLHELDQHEHAVTLHHAIPPEQGMVWVGDEPEPILHAAREALGDEMYDKARERGRNLDLAQTLRWLSATVHPEVAGQTTT